MMEGSNPGTENTSKFGLDDEGKPEDKQQRSISEVESWSLERPMKLMTPSKTGGEMTEEETSITRAVTDRAAQLGTPRIQTRCTNSSKPTPWKGGKNGKPNSCPPVKNMGLQIQTSHKALVHPRPICPPLQRQGTLETHAPAHGDEFPVHFTNTSQALGF